MLSMEGDTAAYSGHLKDAREFSRRAMDSAQHAGEKDAPALYSGTSATERSLVRQHRRSAATRHFGIEALDRPRSAVFCCARVCLHQG